MLLFAAMTRAEAPVSGRITRVLLAERQPIPEKLNGKVSPVEEYPALSSSTTEPFSPFDLKLVSAAVRLAKFPPGPTLYKPESPDGH